MHKSDEPSDLQEFPRKCRSRPYSSPLTCNITKHGLSRTITKNSNSVLKRSKVAKNWVISKACRDISKKAQTNPLTSLQRGFGSDRAPWNPRIALKPSMPTPLGQNEQDHKLCRHIAWCSPAKTIVRYRIVDESNLKNRRIPFKNSPDNLKRSQ